MLSRIFRTKIQHHDHDSSSDERIIMVKRLLREASSAPGLLHVVRTYFDEIEDPVSARRVSPSHCVMSGLAVFGLKYAPLLRFDGDARTGETAWAKRSDGGCYFRERVRALFPDCAFRRSRSPNPV